jgi:RNA polymerase sigma-70 factor (ECF subfamily)
MEGHLLVTGEGTLGNPAADPVAEYARAARSKVDDAYRLAGYILGDAAEAQDAVQDALVKAWRNWSSLREPDNFGPWFDRIVVNTCRDRLRRHRTLRMVDLDHAGEVESRDAFASMLADDEVAAAVSRLGPEHRIVIALRYWRDMTLGEIAETLDVPLGTVKSRLHNALRALRAELGGSGNEA